MPIAYKLHVQVKKILTMWDSLIRIQRDFLKKISKSKTPTETASMLSLSLSLSLSKKRETKVKGKGDC